MSPYDLSPGIKAVRLDQLPPEAWTVVSGQAADASDVAEVYAAVSWLYRCVQIRAGAVMAHPWELRRIGSDDQIANSADPLAEADILTDFPWLPQLSRLNWYVEQAAVMRGKAYLAATVNGSGFISGIRHWLPDSVRERYSDDDGRLIAFDRNRSAMAKTTHAPINGRSVRSGDAVIYFWPPDYAREIGPAENFPGRAALEAAGVLRNMDKFLAGYFDRGLVRASLLMYKEGFPQPDERERVKEWWRRVASGVKNAFASEVVRGDFDVKNIGEGLAELGNTVLTTEKRQDITAAMGIPPGKIESKPGGLGDVTASDELQFQNDTVIPRVDWILSVWNEQVFIPRGYRLVRRSDRLEVFQKAELDKALSLVRLTGQPIITVNEARERLEMPPVDEAATRPLDDFATTEPAEAPETEGSAINEAEDERKTAELVRLRKWLAKHYNGEHWYNERSFTSNILSEAIIAEETAVYEAKFKQRVFADAVAMYKALTDEPGDGATD